MMGIGIFKSQSRMVFMLVFYEGWCLGLVKCGVGWGCLVQLGFVDVMVMKFMM